jgi:hypothetical protein
MNHQSERDSTPIDAGLGVAWDQRLQALSESVANFVHLLTELGSDGIPDRKLGMHADLEADPVGFPMFELYHRMDVVRFSTS